MSVYLLFIMLVVLQQVFSKALYEEEERLINMLLQKATHPDVLPMTDGPVKVKFGLTLNQIVDVNEKQQILTTSMFVRQSWNNPSLSWNPAEFMNITYINILPSRVWKPDVVLYDSVSSSRSGGHLDVGTTRIIVNSSGHNQWYSPINFESHCKIDVRNFPFDQQACVVKLGSWTYDGTRLDITPEAPTADLGSFKASAEWCVMEFPVKKNVLFYACCEEPYVDLTYTLRIERKPLSYVFNLILPCICITILTVLSFCLPPESGERVSLSITIILAMTVFMFIVADKVPPNSDSIPLLGIFYFACMVEETLGLIAVCYTLNLYYTDPHWYKMSPWVRWLIADWAKKLLGIKVNLPRRKSTVIQSTHQNVLEKASLATSAHGTTSSFPANDIDVITIAQHSHMGSKRRSNISRGEAPPGQVQTRDGSADYWRLAAMIADRIMFVVFLIAVSVTFIVVLATVSQECKN
ncbi:acetylcholine receptor subunit alpha-type acr-16-like isoform X2 [Dendronephthya gigantea]|uniref:acetylcholine receptor subunit alpha-type acr-16-like isoform X2 n=1 Tax=Dendronephthya gigantea TaxID=151771 RepID=UPI00106BAE9F|nr:acetylcholine receptor subunit alpha-type acr-16-like isoform X2 [Dendronephthya gigantea]